jgi:hypothetical protein
VRRLLAVRPGVSSKVDYPKVIISVKIRKRMKNITVYIDESGTLPDPKDKLVEVKKDL